MIARLAPLAVTVLQGFHIQPLHNLMHEEAQMLLAQHVPYIGGQKPCLPRIVDSKFRHTSFSLSFKNFSREMFGVLTQTLQTRLCSVRRDATKSRVYRLGSYQRVSSTRRFFVRPSSV